MHLYFQYMYLFSHGALPYCAVGQPGVWGTNYMYMYVGTPLDLQSRPYLVGPPAPLNGGSNWRSPSPLLQSTLSAGGRWAGEKLFIVNGKWTGNTWFYITLGRGGPNVLAGIVDCILLFLHMTKPPQPVPPQYGTNSLHSDSPLQLLTWHPTSQKHGRQSEEGSPPPTFEVRGHNINVFHHLYYEDFNRLKDTIGNCQRQVSSLGVSKHMHTLTNLWKFELNWSSKLRDMNEIKNTLVTRSCVLSNAWFRNLTF